MATGWNVYLNGKLIDTVFYDSNCDSWYVKHGLINHDGYDAGITVRRSSHFAGRKVSSSRK